MFVVWVLSGSTFSELLSKQRKRKLFSEKFSFVMSDADRWGEQGLKVEIGCIWNPSAQLNKQTSFIWTIVLKLHKSISAFYFPLKVPLLKLFIFKQSLTNCFPNTLSAINLLSIKCNQYAFPTHIHAFKMSCKKGISTPICCHMYLLGKPWKKNCSCPKQQTEPSHPLAASVKDTQNTRNICLHFSWTYFYALILRDVLPSQIVCFF